MKTVDAGAVKAVGAFGGGIASTGSVCGIMLGGVAMISSIYSRSSLDEKENPRMWALCKKFIAQFEELAKPYGGTTCFEIAGVNWRDKNAVKEYYSNPDSKRKACIHLVGEAAFILGELLDQESAKK